MDRRESIIQYITKSQMGIEIGPWFAPLAAKRDGYNCLVLDVFDRETLLQKKRDADPAISASLLAQVEEVDLKGSATHIDELVESQAKLGSFDYIISSHNFEHIPNPIRFLQGCGRVLKDGGTISMAIPDRRACFDYFRPITRLAEWLEAFFENRSQPTLAQAFEHEWVRCWYEDNGKYDFSFFRGVSPSLVSVADPLAFTKSFAEWAAQLGAEKTEYRNSHCSVFTPSSFELLIRDAAYLGLVPFTVIDIAETANNEFHAHIRASRCTDDFRPPGYDRIRQMLLHRIHDEAAETSPAHFNLESELRDLRDQLATAERNHRQDSLVRRSEAAQDLKSSARDLANARSTIDQLEAALLLVRNSTSWKITEPLRQAATRLRILRKQVAK